MACTTCMGSVYLSAYPGRTHTCTASINNVRQSHILCVLHAHIRTRRVRSKTVCITCSLVRATRRYTCTTFDESAAPAQQLWCLHAHVHILYDQCAIPAHPACATRTQLCSGTPPCHLCAPHAHIRAQRARVTCILHTSCVIRARKRGQRPRAMHVNLTPCACYMYTCVHNVHE